MTKAKQWWTGNAVEAQRRGNFIRTVILRQQCWLLIVCCTLLEFVALNPEKGTMAGLNRRPSCPRIVYSLWSLGRPCSLAVLVSKCGPQCL